MRKCADLVYVGADHPIHQKVAHHTRVLLCCLLVVAQDEVTIQPSIPAQTNRL